MTDTPPVTREAIMTQARGESASQATEIERSRAIAQVQGALVMAQQRPRDEAIALDKALKSCRTSEVAEGAFFKYKRGDGTVTGASIHLAVELARVWGNIDYGIAELARSDRGGESEMLAYAWDLETNTKATMGFIVPHRRDTRQGPKLLIDMRDIYENNANMGARRLRECIFRVLPPYLKDAAEEACHQTLRAGKGEKPLQVRLAEMVEAFEKLSISRARIEAKHGPVGGLTDVDLANLKVSYRSLTRREIDPEEEFPRVGTEEAASRARRLPGAGGKAAAAADTVSKENPTAAEGRDDSDKGEAHSGADEHPARRVADEIIRAAGLTLTIIDLTNIRSGRADDIAAMPDDIRAEVAQALDDAEKRLKGGK